MRLLDGLRSFITGLGTERDKGQAQHFALHILSDQEGMAMYRTNWLAGKVVDIIPNDMTREWRDWQADKKFIELIEGAEKAPRVDLQNKINEAMKVARVKRGAILIMGIKGQDAESELDIDSVGKDSLEYIHVISREKVSTGQLIDDIASQWYGMPEYFEIRSRDGRGVKIHPSRVVVFKGRACFEDNTFADYWGDSALQILYDALRNATSAQQHIAAMIPEAKQDIIYIPGLSDILRTPGGEAELTKRFAYAAQAKSMFGMLLLEGTGENSDVNVGEKWEQKQLSFAQLPELVRQFLQIASAAADIPVTRLLGESPSGLNATGRSDLENYYINIGAAQTREMQPQLAILDQVIQRSATGKFDAGVYYTWAPLWSMTEKEKAEVFSSKATAARALAGSTAGQIIPVDALSDAMVNVLVEDGTLPGLQEAIDKHGTLADQEPTEAELLAAAGGAQPGARRPAPANANARQRLAANDAAPRTLYVHRKVTNGAEIRAHYEAQGVDGLEDASELHVTIVYSRQPIDWMKVPSAWSFGSEDGNMMIPAGGPRIMEQFGKGAFVLQFNSSSLSWRHMEIREAGASYDFPEYLPHITIAYDFEGDPRTITPWQGKIELGPELFEEVDET